MQKKKIPQTNEQNEISEWATKEEVIKTSFPIYLSLCLIKIFPTFIINFLIKVISFFYFLFNKRAREECLRFQTQFIKNNSNEKITKINVYKQICAFAITLVEKFECWTKKKNPIKLNFQKDDDVYDLINLLNSGKGAFVICSHLGNSEILRNLANKNHIYLNKEVPISVLMDLSSTKVFTQTLKKVNPDFDKNIVDVNSITPATIEILQNTINAGGIVISAGDRISKDSKARYLIAKFLGKDAPWSYGVYLIAMLLKAPTYFMFGLRQKDTSCNRVYDFYIKKSLVNTNCLRKDRETKINELCLEFVNELEKKCKNHPYQWYNFYDFWNLEKEK